MKQIEKQDYTELYEQFQTRTGSLSSEADFSTAMNTIYSDVDFKDLSYVKDDKSAEGYERHLRRLLRRQESVDVGSAQRERNLEGGNRHAEFRQPEAT